MGGNLGGLKCSHSRTQRHLNLKNVATSQLLSSLCNVLWVQLFFLEPVLFVPVQKRKTMEVVGGKTLHQDFAHSL